MIRLGGKFKFGVVTRVYLLATFHLDTHCGSPIPAQQVGVARVGAEIVLVAGQV